MKTEINWPTDEWLKNWLSKHPGKTNDDADCAWWDIQIDKGNPTPYDLTEEQQKQVKAMRKNAKSENSVNAYGKAVKRERKPNEIKRWIMANVKTLFEGLALNGKCGAIDLSNVERALDFTVDGRHFTLTLTEHRKTKE